MLVFLPGWDEISKLRDSLNADYNVSRSASVLPLHSMVSPADQRKVFQRPPKGMRKIVLSTNIAETAVTIDDVVFVIDSGRLKEKSYDAYSAVSTLQAAWISQASAKQRRGRAGRVRPGECYRLYSTSRYNSFAEYQLPRCNGHRWRSSVCRCASWRRAARASSTRTREHGGLLISRGRTTRGTGDG